MTTPRGSRASIALALVVIAGTAAACGGNASTLDTSGPGADRISGLWWVFFGISAFVFLAVVGLLAYGLFRRRRDGDDDRPIRERGSHRLLVGGGIVFPVVVLVTTFLVTHAVMSAEASDDAGDHRVVVEIVGHRWWWEVRYPNAGVVTANEVHLPLGEPVLIRTTSIDVIHSVWIPRLERKIDAIPGRTNEISVTATQPGTFRGECAEYCGLQHARMTFVVVAQPNDDFEAWIAHQQEVPPPVPADEEVRRGQEVFFSSACVYCHTIQGTNATGELGPDLTHIASRATLAAGTVPNRPGYLLGWILDPQRIKPGSLMPATKLSGSEVDALLAYLESLR